MQIDLESKKILEIVPFEVGNLVMIVGGSNIGRVGVVLSRERHPGSHDIVHVKDAAGHTFATRLDNVFLIGKEQDVYRIALVNPVPRKDDD